MLVRDAMSAKILSVSPDDPVATAVREMHRRGVGAAIVVDDMLPAPGILTERDVLRLVAEGADLERTAVRDAMTFEARSASDGWDLDEAARVMVEHGFRHLIVVDARGALVGMVSMRDIVRARVLAAPTG